MSAKISTRSDLRYVGNFENQGGAKILYDVMIHLRETIERDIVDIECGWALSNGDDDRFVVALHIYAVMIEQYKLFAVNPITVQHWRDVYTPAFNQFCEDAQVGEWGNKRRNITLSVFTHLEHVVTLIHSGDKDSLTSGTWQAGVFDSDDAGAFYDELVDKLVLQIVYLLADEALTGRFPGNGDGRVVAAVDILALWGKRSGLYQIKVQVAKHWQTLSLQYFDRDAAASDDQSPEAVQLRAERRKVIASTFDRLIAAC